MNVNAWGPSGWKFIHIISFNYPEKPTTSEMANYKAFYENLKNILPCKYCRESYAGFIQELPIDNYLSSRYKLAYWVYLIHNKVNNKLRKQGYKIPPDPSFDQVKQYYEQFRAKCSNNTCRAPLQKK